MNHRTPLWLVAPALVLAAACGDVGPTVDFTAAPGDSDEVLPAVGPDNSPGPDGPGPDVPMCPPPLDFNTDDNGNPLAAGTILQNQFQGVGIFSVDCVNFNSGHPDTCIIFDSGSPTGGDDDLGTPNQDFGGPGIGLGGELGQVGQNDAALGNVIIIAENDTDSDNDGLVDDPDDESYGGVIELTFDGPTTVESVTLVDIDANEPGIVEVEFDGGGAMSVPFQLLGDNSVQTISLALDNVVTLAVHLCSSGALAQLDYCPETDSCMVDSDCADIELCVDSMCVPKPSSSGGITFVDNDNNGLYDMMADSTLAGVGVALYVDADQNNVPDSVTPVATDTTMGDGSYAFSAVNPFGTYVVHFQDLSMFGFTYGLHNVGSNDNIDSDVEPMTGYTDTFVAFPGQDDTSISCAYTVSN